MTTTSSPSDVGAPDLEHTDHGEPRLEHPDHGEPGLEHTDHGEPRPGDGITRQGADDGPVDQQIHATRHQGSSCAGTVAQGGVSRVGDRLASPFFQHRRQTVTLVSLVVLALLFYLALGQLNLSGATS